MPPLSSTRQWSCTALAPSFLPVSGDAIAGGREIYYAYEANGEFVGRRGHLARAAHGRHDHARFDGRASIAANGSDAEADKYTAYKYLRVSNFFDPNARRLS